MSMNELLDNRESRWKYIIENATVNRINRCNNNEAESLDFTATNDIYEVTFDNVNNKGAEIQFDLFPEEVPVQPLELFGERAFFYVTTGGIRFVYQASDEGIHEVMLRSKSSVDSYRLRWKGLTVRNVKIVPMNQLLDARQTNWRWEINWSIFEKIERCNNNEADSLRFTATNNQYEITFAESTFDQGVNDQYALIEFESIPDGKKEEFPLKAQIGKAITAYFHVEGNKIISEYELSGTKFALPRVEWECDSYNLRWKGLKVEHLRIVTFDENREYHHVTHNSKLPENPPSTTPMTELLDNRESRWKDKIDTAIMHRIKRCNNNEADSLDFTATNDIYEVTFDRVSDKGPEIQFDLFPVEVLVQPPLELIGERAFFYVTQGGIRFVYKASEGGINEVMLGGESVDSYRLRWKGLTVRNVKIVTINQLMGFRGTNWEANAYYMFAQKIDRCNNPGADDSLPFTTTDNWYQIVFQTKENGDDPEFKLNSPNGQQMTFPATGQEEAYFSCQGDVVCLRFEREDPCFDWQSTSFKLSWQGLIVQNIELL